MAKVEFAQWSRKVKYLNMRLELMEYLYRLSSHAYQQQVWIDKHYPPGITQDIFDYAVNFLLDDTRLADQPESCVGVFIYKDELQPLTSVTKRISDLLSKYGTSLSDEEYINKPEWQGMLDAAKSAYTLVVENNKKYQLDIQIKEYYEES